MFLKVDRLLKSAPQSQSLACQLSIVCFSGSHGGITTTSTASQRIVQSVQTPQNTAQIWIVAPLSLSWSTCRHCHRLANRRYQRETSIERCLAAALIYSITTHASRTDEPRTVPE
jgi:fluoride ion exporter CrcB/FEX